MKFLFALLVFSSLSVHADVVQLESGGFVVHPVDRYGNVQTCTFEIQNLDAEGKLVLNVNDCPPVITDVVLTLDAPGNRYMSESIPANTSSREGWKMYEIHPITAKSFKMVSYRVYGNGQADKPRSIIANKP